MNILAVASRSGWLLFLLLAIFGSPQPAWADGSRRPYPSVIAEVTWDDHVFTAALISPQKYQIDPEVESETSLWRDRNFKVGEEMIRRAENHLTEVYSKTYPERAAKGLFQEMFERTPLFDSRSHILLFYQGRGFETLVGTLKSSWTNTDHPSLPSPELYGWPSPSPKLRWVKVNHSDAQVRGGVRELKAFSVLNPPGMDLVPVLLAVARRTGMFNSTNDFITFQKSSEGRFARQRGIPTDIPYFVGKLTGSSPAEKKVWAIPDEYYLSSDPALQGYYEKLGFGMVPERQSLDGSIWMVAPASEIEQWFDRHLNHRPGRITLEKASIQFQQIIPDVAFRDSRGFEEFSQIYRKHLSNPELRCQLLLERYSEALEPPSKIRKSDPK